MRAERVAALGHRLLPASAALPVQRTLSIGDGAPHTNKSFKEWKKDLHATEEERAILNRLHQDPDHEYRYRTSAQLLRGVRKAQGREGWYASGGGKPRDETEARALNRLDPLYQKLHKQIMDSHTNRPYATDALHEGGDLMGAYMDKDIGTAKRVWKMAGSLLSRKTLLGTDPGARPGIEISRIDALRNQNLMDRYENARRDIATRGAVNEKLLYSGHGPDGMTHIQAHGHDPSYGAYDGSRFGKGHGAQGRGAYFTDRVDKAVSYSAKGQGPRDERSFFGQDVLLGNSLSYTERSKFRKRHHNEMVRTLRNPGINKTVAAGEAELPGENMGQYDSLIGQETATSGNAVWGTWRDRKKFDSDEYMVRNADQILPRYRIHYRFR